MVEAWGKILNEIIKPMDEKTVLILHEMPGRFDKFQKWLFFDIKDAGYCCIEGFEVGTQILETMVIARPGLISEIPDIPQEFTDDKYGLKNRYVPFVIHDEVRDINALAVHAEGDGNLTPAAEIARKLALLESLGAKYDIIVGDFNSGLKLSPNRTPDDGEYKRRNKRDYKFLRDGRNFKDPLNGEATYSPWGISDKDPLTSIDHILVGRGLTAGKAKATFINGQEGFRVDGHIFDHALIEAEVSVKR